MAGGLFLRPNAITQGHRCGFDRWRFFNLGD